MPLFIWGMGFPDGSFSMVPFLPREGHSGIERGSASSSAFVREGFPRMGVYPMPSSLVFLYGGTNEAKRKVVWLSRFLSENRHPQGCSTWPPSPPPPCPCSRRGQGIGKGPTGCVPMTPTPFTLHGGDRGRERERQTERDVSVCPFPLGPLGRRALLRVCPGAPPHHSGRIERHREGLCPPCFREKGRT